MRQYTPAYLREFAEQAPPQVQSTLAKLSLCRTRVLGWHRYRCRGCKSETDVYNSCGDRHCPGCGGAKRADWLDRTAQLLVPSINYFQVVCTMPSKLSSLALGNRKVMFDLLFQSTWKSLRRVIESEQGFTPAAQMVLHTWNQKLESHVHVHALVPGGGPSLRGKPRWVTSRSRKRKYRRKPHLVDASELKRTFRDVFLKGLRRLFAHGELKLEGEWSWLQDPAEFERWLKPLEEQTWVAFIEPPPNEDAKAEHVLKYLARYMTGGPISDRRLISHESGDVTFWARSGEKTNAKEMSPSVPYTLSGVEFTRRWSMHILPKGYVKSRCYGGYHNRKRAAYLAQCHDLLDAHSETPSPTSSDTSGTLEEALERDAAECFCSQCGELMELIQVTDRPGWRVVFSGPSRPTWYADG